MSDIASEIREKLLGMRDDATSAALKRYFKTGPGEYGDGDIFLGIKTPQVRAVVKDVWNQCGTDDAAELARDGWHEVRCCGLLILTQKFLHSMKHGDAGGMQEVFSLYTSLYPYINNWDLVDITAPGITGNYEMLFPSETLLDEWILPGHTLWQRRIAMVSVWTQARAGDFSRLVRRAEILTDAPDPLLHKAAGWMLREMGKRGGEAALDRFLEDHISGMPSIMRSYACEKMSPERKEYWRDRARGPLQAKSESAGCL